MTLASGSVICFFLPGNSAVPLEEGWLDGLCGREAASSQSTLWDCYKAATSGRLQDSGTCLAQLLDTSPVWLESQCSFCPRLMDMAVVFLFASSTSSKAEHVFQGSTQRQREHLYGLPQILKNPQVHPIIPFLSVAKWSVCELRVLVFAIVSRNLPNICVPLGRFFFHFPVTYYPLWTEKFFRVITSVNSKLLHFAHPYTHTMYDCGLNPEGRAERKGEMLACIQVQAGIITARSAVLASLITET